jgi:hypothetical protein
MITENGKSEGDDSFIKIGNRSRGEREKKVHGQIIRMI